MRYPLIISLLATLASAPAAIAQPTKPAPPKIVKDPPPPPLVGLTRVGELRPGKGFIDDNLLVADGRILLFTRDGAGGVALQSMGIDNAGALPPVDLTAIAPNAIRVTPIGDKRFYVFGDESPRQGVLVDGTGKIVRAHKPATELAVRVVGGKPVVVAYTHDEAAKGGELHQVALFDPVTGKKIAKKGGKLVLGADKRDAKLDFRPVYFLDDNTVAVGVRGGVWNKKENQRSPDVWAAYDLVSASWVSVEAITDPMGLAKRQPVLAAHPNERVFVRIADDLSGLEVWRDGKVTELTLDQPLELYDPLSVQYAQRGDTLTVSMTIDPTNVPAVKRQKTDPRYLDLFEVQGTSATRKARLLVPKQGVRWGWAGDRLWVLDKSSGFSRGGTALTLYSL